MVQNGVCRQKTAAGIRDSVCEMSTCGGTAGLWARM